MCQDQQPACCNQRTNGRKQIHIKIAELIIQCSCELLFVCSRVLRGEFKFLDLRIEFFPQISHAARGAYMPYDRGPVRGDDQRDHFFPGHKVLNDRRVGIQGPLEILQADRRSVLERAVFRIKLTQFAEISRQFQLLLIDEAGGNRGRSAAGLRPHSEIVTVELFTQSGYAVQQPLIFVPASQNAFTVKQIPQTV